MTKVYTKTKINETHFVIHFTEEDNYVYFNVFPVYELSDSNGETEFTYLDENMNPVDAFDEEVCLKMFKGSVCWRGVWDERVYFTQGEYWVSDLPNVVEVLDMIVLWCKKTIKKNFFSTYYDE